jgi:DNA ligase-1
VRAFAALFDAIDSTTSTNLKVAAMTAYFARAEPADAAWAVYFLSGRKLKRLIGSKQLQTWLATAVDMPQWLLDETYSQVGDLAETIALLAETGSLPVSNTAVVEESVGDTTAAARTTTASGPGGEASLHIWIERLLDLKNLDEQEQRDRVVQWWRTLPYLECLVVNKLLTGAFRVGVSQTLLTRALASHMTLPVATLTHRLMGHWHPTPAFWQSLSSPDGVGEDTSRPYPFFLASPLEQTPESLGALEDWQAEWKWDGIRAQIIRRQGSLHIWSRGEELITDRFPELAAAARRLPQNCVLDGEILAWNEQGVMPFTALQTRIGRTKLTPKLLEQAPVRFVAYDLLEQDQTDLRTLPLRDRRTRLSAVLADAPPVFEPVEPVEANSWEELSELRAQSRERNVEGLMLKHKDSAYGTARQRGAWWKWKIDPFTIDAVMLYAQPGHGRRASLYTDYTFGVWQEGQLVPIAKAYSGLDNKEILGLDRWIRAHTIERFGPVRSVQPVQVFELAFEGINRSPRHRSGVALRFPRIARWRTDKPAAEADTLERLQALL